jgi:hypothetical protein
MQGASERKAEAYSMYVEALSEWHNLYSKLDREGAPKGSADRPSQDRRPAPH